MMGRCDARLGGNSSQCSREHHDDAAHDFRPAVDTEAAAVWERLSPSMRNAITARARGEIRTDEHGVTTLALERRGLIEDYDHESIGSHGFTRCKVRVTDLGRRVAAHGKAVSK